MSPEWPRKPNGKLIPFPQANDLPSILQGFARCYPADKDLYRAQLYWGLAGCGPREINYRKTACLWLGLINEQGITKVGKLFLRKSSLKDRLLLAENVLKEKPIFKEILNQSREGVESSNIILKLTSPPLSYTLSTTKRRLQTVISWINYLKT